MADFSKTKSNTARVHSNDDASKGRRSYSQDLIKADQQEMREDIQKAEKNIAPARIFESRCHVCQHPFRDWIELMLVKGMAHKTLAERVTPPVDRRSIGNHWKKHMDLQDAAFRHLLEREAQIQGLDREEAVGDLVTKRGVLEVALRRGYDDLLNGVTTVEPRDLIQIAKLLGEMDSHQQAVAVDELRAQVQIFIQAIKDVCPPEIQSAIGQQVSKLRKREDISKPIEDIMNDPPKPVVVHELEAPVEAEVVEDEV